MSRETKDWVPKKPSNEFEKDLILQGYSIVAGIDEAGMSPLAGHCTAAAVILPYPNPIKNLNDSKLLSPKVREELYDEIMDKAIAVGIGIGTLRMIEDLNIYWAARAAMIAAIKDLGIYPDYLLIDGNKPLNIAIPQQSLVKGDRKSVSIAAASIIAKVSRDRYMMELDKEYPEYGWAQNKGYPTLLHKQMIKKYGITKYHRVGFKAVQEEIIKRSGANDSW